MNNFKYLVKNCNFRYLIIFVLIIFFIYIFYKFITLHKFEEFLQGYNTLYDFPDDSETIQKMESDNLESIFKLSNIQPLPENYNTQFTKFPDILEFPLDKPLQNILLSKLQKITKQDKLEIFQKIYNIYWNDKLNGDREFIFNMNINIKDTGLFHTLVMYITIKNIKQFMTDSGEFININSFPSENLIINNVSIVKDEELKVSFKPQLQLKDTSIYEIKNKLYLMDPFSTSGKTMKITKEMFKEFNKDLKSRFAKIQKVDGTCFNSSKSTNIKDKCIELGGTWDTYPKSDQECPFYKSNKNYPNTFGKLFDKICQLPLNMKLIGYKQYSANPENKPLCYNCKDNKIGRGSLGFCCDDQLTNKYDNLESPDYAFENDSELRKTYEEEFKTRNLNIQ